MQIGCSLHPSNPSHCWWLGLRYRRSPPGIAFLTHEIKKALSIAENSARILIQYEVPDDIIGPFQHMMKIRNLKILFKLS